MVKICIWMNIPSHYQRAFFMALDARDDVDLQIRYFQGVSQGRAAEGWKNEYAYLPFEKTADIALSEEDLFKMIEDGRERIHLISSYFSSSLVDYFCANNIRWCHWSEMPGIRLAQALGFRMDLYRMLNPLMLMMKRREGSRIGKYAMGAFGQGLLAARAFRIMGIPCQKISNLFYVPAPLLEMEPCESVVEFAKGRKVFLSVGALCQRKGIDVLIKAFAKLETDDSCLVLCGLDKDNGLYQALAKKLGIENQVLFLGAYAADRIAEVYAAADVFVLSSQFDGWGAVLNEAASLGKPLIGTDLCGASWHLIEEGINGFRIKAGSVNKLKTAMKVYVDQPTLIKKHGAVSRELFFREFTPDRNAERMIDALHAWSAK